MTNFSETIKGVIFDLDGTLLDSMHIWEKVDRDFLAEQGRIYTPDVSEAVKKMTIREAAEYLKSRFSLSLGSQQIIDRIEEMVYDQYRYSIPLKKGAYEAVSRLHRKGIRLCVATATYNSLAEAALKRLGLYHLFEFVLTCSDVDMSKNSPGIFLEAAKRLGLKPCEVLVAEDSLHCITAAKAGGFPVLAVYDDYSKSEWDTIRNAADLSVTEVSEMADLI